MVGNPIVVKMIESTIDKTIRDIKTNPKKGVKSLVDQAKRSASSSVQKDFVENLKLMLRNPNNPYYNIIPSLITNVNHLTIKTFIINTAYNSWSYGGRKIKQYKKVYNYNIPWTVIFDFSNKVGGKLSNDTVIGIIEQGKKLGVFTYMFFTDNIDDFSDILNKNPDCAFILYVPPQILTEQNIAKIKSYHNTFFSVLYQGTMNMKAFKDATKLLYDNQCLFGSYGYYSNENTQHILSNRWIDETIMAKSPFSFLIESQNCSQTNASLIHDYIYNSKTNLEHPAFLIDLYEDMGKINLQLSNNLYPFKIMGNGDISCNSLNIVEKPNINHMTLIEALSKQM